MDSASKSTTGTPEPPPVPFKYDPLPTSTSIRLLEILPSPESQIWCSLTNVDLNDEPVFDALSYTWGNPITVHERRDDSDPLDDFKKYEESEEYHIPGQLVQFDLDAFQFRSQHPFIPYEKVEWNAERKHPIQCNGRAVMVTENLIFALRALHRWRFSNDTYQEKFEAMIGHPMSQRIWIDMVCINQEDVDERNSQIRVMGRIFHLARTVIGWLGPEANQSVSAAAALAHFLKTLLEAESAHTVLTSSIWSLFSIQGITEKDVYAIFSLFQRLWFRRAWVVQEAVLARKFILSWGSVLMQWRTVEVIVKILEYHNLYNSLVEFGTAIMRGGPSNKNSKQVAKAGAYGLGHRPEQREWAGQLQVDPMGCRDFVHGVGTLRSFFSEAFFDLPRVRLQLDAPESGPGQDELPPTQHQDKPALNENGFGKKPCMDAISGWHECLLYLFKSCGASDPRDKIFSMFGILEQGGQQMLDIPWDYRISVQDLYTATVSSIIGSAKRLDILAHVQDPSLTKISGLPSWVPDFSVDFKTTLFNDPIKPTFFASGRQSIRESIFDLGSRLEVEGFQVDNIICVAPTQGCYFVRTAMVVAGLPYRYHPGRLRSEDSITRAEAYWRTLLADFVAGVNPARLEWGFDFSDWISEEMVRATEQQRMIWKQKGELTAAKSEQMSEPPYSETFGTKGFWWWALTQGETGKFERPREENETPGEQNVEPDIEARDTPPKTQTSIRFIPDAEFLNSCTMMTPDLDNGDGHRIRTSYPRSKRMPAFRARLAEVKRGHRIFRTTNHYLGLGPISSNIGDDVWVLKGARTPFVLRRRDDGKYQLIGEAYVHGIMQGEAIKGNFKPTPLVLV